MNSETHKGSEICTKLIKGRLNLFKLVAITS